MLIMFTPLLLFGVSFVVLKMRTIDRRTAIDDELASFSALASVMESVNVSLFSTFVMLSTIQHINVLSAMKREGQRIKSLFALGNSPTDALMFIADSHPNIQFRDFVEGYISSFNTGGSDTSLYLQEQARRFFRFMQSKMILYTKQADMIAQLLLVMMLLLPMMGLSMTFFATGNTAQTMMIIMILIFPLVAVMLICFIQQKQPRFQSGIRTPWITYPAGAIVAGLAYVIHEQIWESIGMGIITYSFFNMYIIKNQLAESAHIDDALPEFMRQITRFRNIGLDIMHAIWGMRREIIQKRAVGSVRFNHTFDDLIDSIYKRMASGSTLEASVENVRMSSWNARLLFFILGKVHESGGGTSKVLDDIARWITEYTDARKEMVANLRASLMTAFIGPVLMVMMTVVSEQLESSLVNNPQMLAYPMDHMSSTTTTPTLMVADGLSELLTITASVCMGLVLSKINYFTIKHTMFVGIITTVTMLLLWAIPYVPEFGL